MAGSNGKQGGGAEASAPPALLPGPLTTRKQHRNALKKQARMPVLPHLPCALDLHVLRGNEVV